MTLTSNWLLLITADLLSHLSWCLWRWHRAHLWHILTNPTPHVPARQPAWFPKAAPPKLETSYCAGLRAPASSLIGNVPPSHCLCWHRLFKYSCQDRWSRSPELHLPGHYSACLPKEACWLQKYQGQTPTLSQIPRLPCPCKAQPAAVSCTLSLSSIILATYLPAFLKRPAGPRYIQMAKGQQKSTICKSQGKMAQPEPSYTTTASPRCPYTAEAQEDDLKSNLKWVIEAFKDEMNKSRKEIQKNRIK